MASPIANPSLPPMEHPDLTAEGIRKDFVHNLFTRQAKFPAVATRNDSTSRSPTRCATGCWSAGSTPPRTYFGDATRTVCYLSAEFLLGPQLGNNLLNLGIMDDAVREALTSLGHRPRRAARARGGARVSATAASAGSPPAIIDSLATLEVPAIGYGIRYEFGIFDQEIRDGWQVELTDTLAALRQPLGDPRAPRSRTRSASAATPRPSATTQGR